MRLETGSRLGPYEITAFVGAGGMGEVYRARDTRLDRTVALKVLPAALASDAQLRERLEREGRAVAALNHPHICTLYDVGRETPAAGEAIDYLVMEFLEGETLADRLRRGSLPVDQALRYAVEIAGALDRAHREGVVHRDLKPGNIMVTKAGTKLLDFGLAKRAAPAVAGAAQSMLPTTPPNLTAQGTILGTFQYMAPEQLEGREADARSDIFAFGCVAYEMVTGRKAFEGKTQVGLIGAILERDPAPVSTIVPAAPAALDRILQRCLTKDPDERWQSAADLCAQLTWVTEPAVLTAAAATVADTPGRTQHSVRRWMSLAAVMLVASIGLGVTALYVSLTRGDVPALRFTVPSPPTTTFEAPVGGQFRPIVSPDGRWLAFTARETSGLRIWVRPLDALDARPLEDTDGVSYPFWSPDSRSIAFFAQGKLKRIDVTGGPPVTLCDAPGGRGGAWNRDGIILFAPGPGGPLFRVGAGGGEPVATTSVEPGSGHRHPSFLPDGRHFLFVKLIATGEPEVWLGDLDSTESARLLLADSNAVYAAPGDLFFVRENTLMRQPFDLGSLALTGDPMPVAEQIAVGQYAGAFSVSETGVLVYRTGPRTAGNLQLAWFDRTGTLLETVGAPGNYRGVALSPDGTRIAVHRHDGNGGDIWLMDLERRGMLSRLTFDASADNGSPIWSPDGRRIVFGSRRNGTWGVYEKAANGASTEQMLAKADRAIMPTAWSPDSRSLVYWLQDPNTNSDQWLLPLDGDKKAIPLLQTRFVELDAQISPNGKQVAYSSNESGRFEVYVRPFPSGDGKWQISSAGGGFPRWRADGTELFYLTAGVLGKLMSVKVNPAVATFEYGEPTELFDSGYVDVPHGGGRYHPYAVSPDGQRFLIPRPEAPTEDAGPSPITVIVNWTRALAR